MCESFCDQASLKAINGSVLSFNATDLLWAYKVINSIRSGNYLPWIIIIFFLRAIVHVAWLLPNVDLSGLLWEFLVHVAKMRQAFGSNSCIVLQIWGIFALSNWLRDWLKIWLWAFHDWWLTFHILWLHYDMIGWCLKWQLNIEFSNLLTIKLSRWQLC